MDLQTQRGPDQRTDPLRRPRGVEGQLDVGLVDPVQLQNGIREKQEEWEHERQTRRPVISEEDVAFIVSRWTGIPVTRLQEAEAERLLRMEETLHESVVGQDEAIQAVAAAVRRSRSGYSVCTSFTIAAVPPADPCVRQQLHPPTR